MALGVTLVCLFLTVAMARGGSVSPSGGMATFFGVLIGMAWKLALGLDGLVLTIACIFIATLLVMLVSHWAAE